MVIKYIILVNIFAKEKYIIIYLQSLHWQIGGCGFFNVCPRFNKVAIISKCPYCAAIQSGVVSSGKSKLSVIPIRSNPGEISSNLFNNIKVILCSFFLIACRTVSPISISSCESRNSTMTIFPSITARYSAVTPYKKLKNYSRNFNIKNITSCKSFVATNFNHNIPNLV